MVDQVKCPKCGELNNDIGCGCYTCKCGYRNRCMQYPEFAGVKSYGNLIFNPNPQPALFYVAYIEYSGEYDIDMESDFVKVVSCSNEQEATELIKTLNSGKYEGRSVARLINIEPYKKEQYEH